MGSERARLRRLLMLGMALALAVEPLAAWAQQAPIVYPAQGQTLDQQAADESACRSWAQQQTGMYPNQAPPGYYGNPNTGAPVLGGAARGAALGAVGGAIAGDGGGGGQQQDGKRDDLDRVHGTAPFHWGGRSRFEEVRRSPGPRGSRLSRRDERFTLGEPSPPRSRLTMLRHG